MAQNDPILPLTCRHRGIRLRGSRIARRVGMIVADDLRSTPSRGFVSAQKNRRINLEAACALCRHIARRRDGKNASFAFIPQQQSATLVGKGSARFIPHLHQKFT